ncbi:MAG: flotillin-like protein FloA [Myxococcota bacterium]|nr:flotillin-like protein FloA [Myxococcota bacterium]
MMIVTVIASLICVGLFFYFVPVGLYIAARLSGAGVGIGQLIAMRLRRVTPTRVVNPRISAVKAGLDLPIEQLESHYLAGGDVEKVIFALISAQKAGIRLSFERAAAIDLAGRDVLEAVKMSVNPKVIETPKVSAVSADGIQLVVVSRITLRANIDRLVGGAGEETILARVGEGIVTTIGSAANHKEVLENPDQISIQVIDKGLDSGTAFEILSIDIADVDVGSNIGAKLQMDQAEADKNIAQAQAEGRRAMAVAQEQEMRARYQEARAKVAEAEAQVPLAIADALKSGNFGYMDYLQVKNLEADTAMRGQMAQIGQGDRKE